jgi:3'(2'), 5'-bisphosphate nucleotidase
MHAPDLRRLAEELLPAVLAAGRVQMAHFAAGVAVERKADRSPVTIADRQSEEIILESLARAAPGVPTIAEEAVTAGHVPPVGDLFFLVDPLDGTNGFIKGRPDFTVNIGLIERGRPVFGIVYAPAHADCYLALGPAEAANAQVRPDAQVRTLADCGFAPIRTRVPDPHALAALISHSHINADTTRFLDCYGVVERRPLGSSLKFALLAKGEADLYPRIAPTSEWDTAAGHAVLAAAGGAVTTPAGAALTYGHSERGFETPEFVAWGRGPLPKRRED